MATRESTIELLLGTIPPGALVVACNGKLGRELWELRQRRGESTDDFILVGAMGCALPVAMGLALNTKKPVYCLLGDGNFLMKMGAIATLRKLNLRNLRVFVLDNNCHDSTGGQETAFRHIRFALPWNLNLRVIDVEPGARLDLGRPNVSPAQITQNFRLKAQV
jgi:thiamine pyrophosphate-dependent acetolactate synthase large subunit-like protein